MFVPVKMLGSVDMLALFETCIFVAIFMRTGGGSAEVACG